ncbi:MAG TPA: hypothetical protein PJ994_09610, partial [Tepidiformaceae bacterium]|nr:hypothetical protein [Tepidiformaceae bacterium]
MLLSTLRRLIDRLVHGPENEDRLVYDAGPEPPAGSAAIAFRIVSWAFTFLVVSQAPGGFYTVAALALVLATIDVGMSARPGKYSPVRVHERTLRGRFRREGLPVTLLGSTIPYERIVGADFTREGTLMITVESGRSLKRDTRTAKISPEHAERVA